MSKENRSLKKQKYWSELRKAQRELNDIVRQYRHRLTQDERNRLYRASKTMDINDLPIYMVDECEVIRKQAAVRHRYLVLRNTPL